MKKTCSTCGLWYNHSHLTRGECKANPSIMTVGRYTCEKWEPRGGEVKEPEKAEKVCDWGYDGGGWPVPLCQPYDSGWCFKPEACELWVFCPLCGGKINRTTKEV